MEGSVSSDFQNFIKNVTPEIGETYFNLINNITICNCCSIEIFRSLVQNHKISKELKVLEKYSSMKCMTHCDYCNEETKKMNGENI